MKVNVSKLKNEIVSFQDLLKEYEENYLNFYQELSSVSFFWQDSHADNFFKNVNLEKIKVQVFHEELMSIYGLYKFLIDRYQSFGEIIEFDLNMMNTVFSKFNLSIEKMNDIIHSYQGLDLSFCDDIAGMVKNEYNEILNNKKQLESIFENVKEYFYEIEEIEKEVKLRIARITVELLQESEINEFI